MAKKQKLILWTILVRALERSHAIYSDDILKVFLVTPRSQFVPPEIREEADSADAALSIGKGQTISQPTTVAIMLELIHPKPGDRVLDIGTGSGWQAALLSKLVGLQGHVYTIERVPALAEKAAERFRRLGLTNITTLVGDASDGLPQRAPFNAVIAAAEAPAVPPKLLEQLAPGGRLLQPISGMGLRVVMKDTQGNLSERDIPGFVFVPLVPSGEKPARL